MTCVELSMFLMMILCFVVGTIAGWHRWHNVFASLGSGVVGAFAGLFSVLLIVITLGLSIAAYAKITGDKDFFKDKIDEPHSEDPASSETSKVNP